MQIRTLTLRSLHTSLARFGLIGIVCLVAPDTEAAHRCTDAKGRVTFQDFPCDGAQPAAPTANSGARLAPAIPGDRPTATAGDVDYSSFRGAWRGPAQMHFMSGGVRDLAAHRVTPIVIEIGNDGRVQGVISEAGCKTNGLGSQFVQPSMASLDVTLTTCTDRRFNGRYSGNLSAFKGPRETKLSLSRVGITSLPQQKVEHSSIEAVLKR